MNPVAQRIARFIEDKGYTYSAFAETIGVQRTIISHIISGRNRPSLDIVQRILRSFPELDGEELILGERKAVKKEDPGPVVGKEEEMPDEEGMRKAPNKRIERVVICYEDGSFASYEPDA